MPKRKQGGFVHFIRKLEGKELEDDYEHLLLAQERLGRKLYQRYEKLLEWIAGECNWSGYLRWVILLSDTERQACRSLRWDVLSIGNYTVDSMGMYNGDRSSTLRKAVEHILSNHQGEQQETVSDDSSREPTRACTSHYYWAGFSRYLTYDTIGTTPDAPRSGEEPVRNDASRTRPMYRLE